MKSFYLTDTGKVRDHNEDSVIIVKNREGNYLLAVADGMGGHSCGEVASSITIQYLAHHFQEDFYKMNKDQAVNWINNSVNEINSELFDLANKTREKHVGSKVHLRGLIEFSNVCSNNCKYCGLRLDNKNIERYNLTFDDILYSANIAKQLGYKTLVLQSGENQAYPMKQMKEIISELKKMDFAIIRS